MFIVIIISGASGAGKTSLVKTLLNVLPQITLSISHTTRPIRSGEKEGVDYHFCSQDVFSKAIKNNEFVEYAQVFDNYYGTHKATLVQQLKSSDVIVEIDWQGAQQVQKIFADAISISIIPPSIASLGARLSKRGDKAAIIKRRMQVAKDEISHYQAYDYIVINDDFKMAATELKSILIAQRASLKNRASAVENILNYDR